MFNLEVAMAAPHMALAYSSAFCHNDQGRPVFLRCRGVKGELRIACKAGFLPGVEKVKIVLKGKQSIHSELMMYSVRAVASDSSCGRVFAQPNQSSGGLRFKFSPP